MAILRLIVRLALRNRGRTLITALGVGVTLLAFLILRTLVASWYTVNEEAARSDQFEVRHKISINYNVFRRMGDKIRAIPGVKAVSPLIWFSGYYKDEKTRFPQLAVEGDSYFEIHPEYVAPPDQMQAYMDDMSGALVGRALAEKYGWKIGDKVTLKGTLYRGNWDFTVRGVYAGANETVDTARMYLHYKHVQARNEHAHRLVVKADAAAAKRIDALFANSDTPTRTESQLAVRRSLASWSMGMIAAIDAAAVIVLAVLMLVLGNGMSMATREATREYATLRAIGYRPRHIMTLVLAEAIVVAGLGLLVGLAVAPAVLRGFAKLLEDRLGGAWQLELDGRVVLGAIGAAIAATLLASGIPAWRSGRLRIVEALRRVA